MADGKDKDKKDDKPKRPEPPAKVESPLPVLAEAQKSIGAMQVLITKVCDELDTFRQREYSDACKAFDALEDNKKSKETADKEKADYVHLQREVKRLKAKLEKRPCPADKDQHPMAHADIVALVLKHGDFDRANLKAFCLVGKAWVVPCRTRIFADLSDLKVTTKARCDGLIELFSAKQALCEVVKSMTFSFQPSDPSTAKQAALRESLPSPIQFILLLTLCEHAKKLVFTNVATFGATKIILNHIAPRIEEVKLDPFSYSWYRKELEFGSAGPRAVFGSWPALAKLTIARVALIIESPHAVSRRGEPAGRPARCPLTHLTLENCRLDGRIYHMLEGAFGGLTHLSLVHLGSLSLQDLCQTLTEHGVSLQSLTLIQNEIVEHENSRDYDDLDEDDVDVGWRGGMPGNGGNSWGGTAAGGGMNNQQQGDQQRRNRFGAFDRALSACINLTHLSIEPGSLPVYAPATLFRPLVRLETLEFNKREANAYDLSAWGTLLGLLPVLAEQKRKLKRIHFGHDWPSDDRRMKRLRENWKRFADDVAIGRLPS